MPKLSMPAGEGPWDAERVYSKTPSEEILEGWNAFEVGHNLICRIAPLTGGLEHGKWQMANGKWQIDSAVNFSRRGVNLVDYCRWGEL